GCASLERPGYFVIAVEVGPVRAAHADECRRIADADRRHVDIDLAQGGEVVADRDTQEALNPVEDRRDFVFDLLLQLLELRRDPVDLRLEDGLDLRLEILTDAVEGLPDGRGHCARDAVEAPGQRLLQRVLDRADDLILDRLEQQLYVAVPRGRGIDTFRNFCENG